MPFLIALLGIIGVAYVWANRARNARDAVGDIADMANDVRLAARRFGFSRKMNVHPVESIEDPRLEEMEVLGRWFMNECGGAEPAVARISRKLFKLSKTEHAETLMSILKASTNDDLSDKQRDAVEDITRALRPR